LIFNEQLSIKSDGTNKLKPVYMSHVILSLDIDKSMAIKGHLIMVKGNSI